MRIFGTVLLTSRIDSGEGEGGSALGAILCVTSGHASALGTMLCVMLSGIGWQFLLRLQRFVCFQLSEFQRFALQSLAAQAQHGEEGR